MSLAPIEYTLEIDGSRTFLALIASPYYYASPENQWDHYVHPHLPHWAIPSNEGSAMTWFFEGLPAGERLPWESWLIPLLWWLSLIFVFYFVCLCIVTILRRQWVDNERLLFPLIEVPRDLVRMSDDRRLLPAFMRSRAFWIGFAVPMFIVVWNVASYFNPTFPQIPVSGKHVRIARGFPSIPTIFWFPVIGFAYFANLEVTFSVWFFYLLAVVQEGVCNRVGFSIGRSDFFVWGMAATGWQSFGAFLVFVLWGLWMARRHLWAVLHSAVTTRAAADDHREMLSCRTAVFGAVLGFMYMACWLARSGMEAKVIALFLTTVVLICLGITRVVVQAGVFYLTPPMVAQPFTMFTLGTSALSASSMNALCLAYAWHGDVQSIFMTAVAHSAKLGETARLRPRVLAAAIGLAVVAGFAASILFIILMGYDMGAYNFGSWTYRGMGHHCFGNIVGKMRNPSDPDWGRLSFLGIGATAMAALTFFRYRLAWWPLHPIGLAVASSWPIRRIAFSLFLAWAAKGIILNLGGTALYRRSRPLFVGMMLGYFVGIGISFIVDAIWFCGQGHGMLNA